MQPQDPNTGFNPAPVAQAATMPMDQAIERLRTAINVLVTVSNNPSVDQLSSAIAFTLLLNKMGKHATAVFSGDVPSTIEFLKPDETIEKNTDSLRDFIVSLDKSKADKLRYKVEENVVKIFITPYKTSLSEKDLNFSQGDFNIDAIVALGVSEREQLDQAIIAHGRILHDATVITVSAGQQSSTLGAINWQDASASSLCEMLVTVGDVLQPGLLDNQIATAYLTGIVAQTERFRNATTTPKTMTVAAQLMAAGANQQLIASSLETTVEKQQPQVAQEAPEIPAEPAKVSNDGELNIEHNPGEEKPSQPVPVSDDNDNIGETQTATELTPQTTEITANTVKEPADEVSSENIIQRRMLEPLPVANGVAAVPNENFAGGVYPIAGTASDDGLYEPNINPLTASNLEGENKMLNHATPIINPANDDDTQTDGQTQANITQDVQNDLPAEPQSSIVAPAEAPVQDEPEILTLPPALDNDTLRSIEKTFSSEHITKDPTSTLNEIEEVVDSPHLDEAQAVDGARDAVEDAIAAAPYDPNRPEPMQALNANPIDMPPIPAFDEVNHPSNDPVLAGLGLVGHDPATDTPQNDLAVQQTPTPQQPPAPLDDQNSVQPPVMPTSEQGSQSPPPVPPPMFPIQ